MPQEVVLKLLLVKAPQKVVVIFIFTLQMQELLVSVVYWFSVRVLLLTVHQVPSRSVQGKLLEVKVVTLL